MLSIANSCHSFVSDEITRAWDNLGSPLADHVVDLPVGKQFTFHLERISFQNCDPLQRLHGKFNALSIDELWNRIQQSRKLPSIAFGLTSPRHLGSLPALPEQPLSTEPPKASTGLNLQVDSSHPLAHRPGADEKLLVHLLVHLKQGFTREILTPPTPPVQPRAPTLTIQRPNVASCLQKLTCQLTAKADNRLRTWLSETIESIHSKTLEALKAREACESCADRKFRFHLKLGKKCERSTLSAWLGERKTMWRDLRRVWNPESSTSTEEDKCNPMVEAESRLQKQVPMIDGPKAKRKKPKQSGANADSRKKKVKCNTNARRKSIGNTAKMKASGTRASRPKANASAIHNQSPKAKRKKPNGTNADSRKKKTKYTTAAGQKSIGNAKTKPSGTHTRRPKVNASAACRIEGSRCKGSRCKGSRFSKRHLPTRSRKGSTGTTRASGTKRKRHFVDTEERKTPRPQMRFTRASVRSTTDSSPSSSSRTSSRRFGGDEFNIGDCVQAWDSGLYTATVKGVENRDGRVKYLVSFVDKSRGELSRWMNANDLLPMKRNETKHARSKPSFILPGDNAKCSIMPQSRRKKSVRARRWYCKVLVGKVECEKIGMIDGMCRCHHKAFKAARRSTKG